MRTTRTRRSPILDRRYCLADLRGKVATPWNHATSTPRLYTPGADGPPVSLSQFLGRSRASRVLATWCPS
jgi:hypothetical protein